MSTLVTGASGFIGSHLCKTLVENGEKVIGLSHSNKIERLSGLIGKNNFDICYGDIRDIERLKDICTMYRVKTIYHLAAQVPYSKSNDLLGTNANGTRNLINSAYLCGVENFIYASSMGVYSIPPKVLPVPETHETKPNTEYGQTKLIGEICCKAMSKSMRTVIVRYAGAFGKGMDESRVIPLFINKALNNEPLEVLGLGDQSSDFTAVEDIVRGTILAGQKGKSGCSYNIGSGHETRLLDLAMDIIGMTHSKSIIEIKGDKIDRPFRFYLDIDKARNELGYEPMVYADALRMYVEQKRKDVR